MPHVVFQLGGQSAAGDLAARQLIPGVEPGMGIHNIFAQRRTKRALLLGDCWIEPMDLSAWLAADDVHIAKFYLKLSQEQDLDPGLLLPIGYFGVERLEVSAVAQAVAPIIVNDLWKAQGTVWSPLYVGIRYLEAGNITVDVDVHLDYDVVEVPWEQWFIGWDYLDNVVNNARQY